MPKLVVGAAGITDDEPALALYELNLKTPDERARHRYQIVMVIRGDKPAEFRIDLGDAKKFKHDQIRIPGGARDDATGKFHIEHTVGELKDIARWVRDNPPFDKKELAQVNKIRV